MIGKFNTSNYVSIPSNFLDVPRIYVHKTLLNIYGIMVLRIPPRRKGSIRQRGQGRICCPSTIPPRQRPKAYARNPRRMREVALEDHIYNESRHVHLPPADSPTQHVLSQGLRQFDAQPQWHWRVMQGCGRCQWQGCFRFSTRAGLSLRDAR